MMLLRCCALLLVVSLLVTPTQAAPTTEPSTKPAKVTAEVTDEVRPLLDQVATAYKGLKSLKMAGTITGEFDVLGRQRKEVKEFTASYAAPMSFRHEIAGDVQVGSTGEKLYAYTRRSHAYAMHDVPKEKPTFDKMPAPIPTIISLQNPSLALALSSDPVYELTDNVTALTRAPDADIGGRPHPALRLALSGGDEVEMRFDPQTHLVRQVVFDMREGMSKGGAVDVKRAALTMDYTTLEPGAELSAEQFAWTPPMGARDAEEAKNAREQMMASFKKIEGQPAPAFELTGLDGKAVSLSDAKGQVVLLDFWATWCGPCVASMPQLEQLHKEKSAAGLKVYAVNVAEEKEKVQKFIETNKYTFPVLLDADSKVAEAYGADKAIPYQVLIGKDGVVKKVVVGAGGEAKAEMDKAIHEALTGE